MSRIGHHPSKKTRKLISIGNTTHGEGKVGYQTVEYITWLSIKTRCYNSKSTGYKYWGGRGIRMSEEWRNNYLSFLKDMGRRPKGRFSIERVDVNGDYCKENCIWIKVSDQCFSRRSCVTYRGEVSSKASLRLGGCSYLVRSRIKAGWSIRRAFTTPLANK